MSLPEPLKITAHVPGQISLPNGTIGLDSLLTAAVAVRDNLPPPASAADCKRLDIPIELEPGGRFHLCSDALYELTEFDLRYVNRRAPIEQFQMLGPPKGRVQITAGVDKSYRIPLEVGHLVGARIDWYASGDAEAIRELLAFVGYLGKKRSVGLGKVARWDVASCETWDGFPVMRDGKPLRPLPIDWPGLDDPPFGYASLTPPRWDHASETLLAVPALHR